MTMQDLIINLKSEKQRMENAAADKFGGSMAYGLQWLYYNERYLSIIKALEMLEKE